MIRDGIRRILFSNSANTTLWPNRVDPVCSSLIIRSGDDRKISFYVHKDWSNQFEICNCCINSILCILRIRKFRTLIISRFSNDRHTYSCYRFDDYDIFLSVVDQEKLVRIEINSSVCSNLSNTGYCDGCNCYFEYSSGRPAYYQILHWWGPFLRWEKNGLSGPARWYQWGA